MKKEQKYSIVRDNIGFYVLVYLIAAVAFVVTLYPFLYIIAVSLSDSQAVYTGKVFLFPVDFTLNGYAQVFKQSSLWIAYGNTIFYTVVGTALNIVVTLMGAYPLSKRRFFARKALNFCVAFTMYFSAGMIPTYLVVMRLGLYNTRWAMLLPSLIGTYNLMVCRSAFTAIPEELAESAEIDGANDVQFFLKITVWLVMPTVAVLVLYYAVAHWNSYMPALLYLSQDKLMPVQVLLRRVLIQASDEFVEANIDTSDREATSLQIRYVTIVVATLPVLVIYPFIQRYFVKGVMLGAVKG